MGKIIVFLFLAALGLSCKKEELKPGGSNQNRILKKVIVKNADSSQTVTMDFSYLIYGEVSEVKKLISRSGKQDSIVTLKFYYDGSSFTRSVTIRTYFSLYVADEIFVYHKSRFISGSIYAINLTDYTTNIRLQRRYATYGMDYIQEFKDSSWIGNQQSLKSDSILIKHPDEFTTQLSFPPYSSCIYPYLKYNKLLGELEYGSGRTCGADNKIMKIIYSNRFNPYQKELWDAFSPAGRIDGLLDRLVFNGESANLPSSKTTEFMKEEYEYEVDGNGWIEKINVYQTDAGGTKALKSVYTLFY